MKSLISKFFKVFAPICLIIVAVFCMFGANGVVGKMVHAGQPAVVFAETTDVSDLGESSDSGDSTDSDVSDSGDSSDVTDEEAPSASGLELWEDHVAKRVEAEGGVSFLVADGKTSQNGNAGALNSSGITVKDTAGYLIQDADDLAEFARQVNAGKTIRSAVVYLMSDIDLSGKIWTPIGFSSSSGKYFSGKFFGNGHTIKGITFDKTVKFTYYGLFGYCTGTIVDLIVAAPGGEANGTMHTITAGGTAT